MALTGRFLVKTMMRLQDGPKSVASFGYPDILSDEPTLRNLLGGCYSDLTYFDDSGAISARHNRAKSLIPRSERLFELLGSSLTVFDVVKERGVEIICDLNYPNTLGQFDMVLDPGTLEHCFNVAQAIKNMAECVKEGGLILHQNPFLSGNHGFYNFSPTFYSDFYTHNGFEVIESRLIAKDLFRPDVPRTERFIPIMVEYDNFIIAKRSEIKEIRWPTQTKYKS